MFKKKPFLLNIFIKKISIVIIYFSSKKELFIISIVFGLFLAATIGYYLGNLRYLFVFIVFVYIFIIYLLKDIEVFFLFSFLMFLIVLNLYSYYFLVGLFDFSSFHVYFLVLVGYILAKENLFNSFKPYVKFILLFNLYYLINEKLTGVPLVPFGEGRDLSLIIYGQGVFGYTKNAADAIGLAILLFRRDLFWKFIILISVILIGVRSSMVFVGLIIIIDFFIYTKVKINIKFFLKFMLFVLIISSSIYFLRDLIFLDRFEALFRSESTTYTSRYYYGALHTNLFAELPIFQLLFGSGTYLPALIGNGSENLHIMFYTHYGLINYSIWLLFFLFIIYTGLKKDIYLVYPLILYLLLGIGVRWGLGWMGGILLYTYVFNIYFKRKEFI